MLWLAGNVILPITVIALALGLMIGDGATAYFSLCLGQKELKNAAQGVGNALILTIIVSVVLTVGSFVWLQPLCVLFGATETILNVTDVKCSAGDVATFDLDPLYARGMPIEFR